MQTNQEFYSNGKLLLTGEYVVLDNAKALAVPTQYGQTLKIKAAPTKDYLKWTSLDHNKNSWFSCKIDAKLHVIETSNTTISNRLLQILKAIQQLNPKFGFINYKVKTTLSFPKNWGLGTSSTLITNLAQWAGVNPFKLLSLTFGGSGYDIACAQNNSPIVYQLHTSCKRTITPVNFNPNFKTKLHFAYLNKKQNSRDGIAHYKANRKELNSVISEISDITSQFISTQSLLEFMRLLNEHESIISKIIKQPTVKELLFNDFEGSIKSLGAWGGDFILIASEENPKTYFEKKGFKTFINYDNMILNP